MSERSPLTGQPAVTIATCVFWLTIFFGGILLAYSAVEGLLD